MAKGNNDRLYRVQRFEFYPSKEEESILRRVSSNLGLVYNSALAERQVWFDTHLRPLYEKLKESETEDLRKEVKRQIKGVYKSTPSPTLFDQINGLTGKRQSDEEFGLIPRNWQEETLDTLNGGFASFMALRNKGDVDARPPRGKNPEEFCEITGRSGFKLIEEGEKLIFVLSCGKLEATMRFPIPNYQKGKLLGAQKIKKFTLYRDERNLDKPGRWWISIAYEIAPGPLMKKGRVITCSADPVFVHLGASSIGVISAKGEQVIELWRPDQHWQPEIDKVITRMAGCTKGSRKWTKRNEAKRRMQKRAARQQKQNHREVVAKLLELGKHFVVSEVVVRSKDGKLADSAKPERGGRLGLNWSAQNTGSFGELVLWLSEKTREHGGSVVRHKLSVPAEFDGERDKLSLARMLKKSYLQSR